MLISKQSALALSHIQKTVEWSNIVSCLPLSLDFKVHPRESFWQSEFRNCAGESWRTLSTGTKAPSRHMLSWLSVWSRWRIMIGQVLCGIEVKLRRGELGTDTVRVRWAYSILPARVANQVTVFAWHCARSRSSFLLTCMYGLFSLLSS